MKIKLTLKDTYQNEFMTTQTGLTFYSKNNQQKAEKNIIEVELDNDIEARLLFEQGILVSVGDTHVTPESIKKPNNGLTQMKEEVQPEIIQDTPSKNVISEKVGKENTPKVKEILASVEKDEKTNETKAELLNS